MTAQWPPLARPWRWRCNGYRLEHADQPRPGGRAPPAPDHGRSERWAVHPSLAGGLRPHLQRHRVGLRWDPDPAAGRSSRVLPCHAGYPLAHHGRGDYLGCAHPRRPVQPELAHPVQGRLRHPADRCPGLRGEPAHPDLLGRVRSSRTNQRRSQPAVERRCLSNDGCGAVLLRPPARVRQGLRGAFGGQRLIAPDAPVQLQLGHRRVRR